MTQGFYCQPIALKCHFSSNTKSNVTHLQYVREGVPPSLSSNSRKHSFMPEKWCLQLLLPAMLAIAHASVQDPKTKSKWLPLSVFKLQKQPFKAGKTVTVLPKLSVHASCSISQRIQKPKASGCPL